MYSCKDTTGTHVTAFLAEAKDNVWVYRKAFHVYKQQTDQTFKQFYAEIVKLASMCEFGRDCCEHDKIRAVDQCLLIKLVLHTSDSIAQKLIEVPDLDLPAAVRTLETYDSLQKTTNALTENDFNAIGRIAKQFVTQTLSGYRSTLSNQGQICTRCLLISQNYQYITPTLQIYKIHIWSFSILIRPNTCNAKDIDK